MSRRFLWFPIAAALALTSFVAPSSRGTASAGPGPKPVGVVAAACKDDLGKSRQELTDARAEITRLRAENDQMKNAERTRAAKLQAQLGAPMIDRLH